MYVRHRPHSRDPAAAMMQASRRRRVRARGRSRAADRLPPPTHGRPPHDASPGANAESQARHPRRVPRWPTAASATLPPARQHEPAVNRAERSTPRTGRSGCSHTTWRDHRTQTPIRQGVTRCPSRDTPAGSLTVAMAGQARSHRGVSCEVDAHDRAAGGRERTAVRPVMALAVGQPAMRRPPVLSCFRRWQWVRRLKPGPAAAGPGFQTRLLSVITTPDARGPGRGPGRREYRRCQCRQCDLPCHRCSQCVGCTGAWLW
jgi:hypothetical protein